MALIADLRKRRYAPEIRRRAEEYAASPADADGRARIQLDLLNREWERVGREVPYYAGQVASGRLPRSFGSLREFAESVPLVGRPEVREHGTAMTSAGPNADFFRMTGGSTSEPVQLPAWSSEQDHTRPDMWLGRSWFGIDPSSRLFLLWGHSHLLGTGIAGQLRALKVAASDRLLGYLRFSAYDLRREKLREAASAILAHRPAYMIGYSVALDLYARANEDRGAELRTLRLRAVVGTAESFPSPDSVRRLEDLFGCPVTMEYGAVETGLMAHGHPEGGHRAFWRSYLLEAVEGPPGKRIVVTSLYPRKFPLVRYDMGDEVDAGEPLGTGEGLAKFSRIVGRCNDAVILPDGAVIHSEVFTHAVRPCRDIAAYQVVQSGEDLRIHYLSSVPLSPEIEEGIRARLVKVHPWLAMVSLDRVPSLERSIAGKTPMVVRRSAS